MEQYIVTGMSCAACQSKVEKAVNAVNGVESCAVSLLTNSMGVEGVASSAAIIAAVEAAGYGASLKSNKNNTDSQKSDELSNDAQVRAMKKRLVASVIILVPLMYVSMGHMMWNWPLPHFLANNHTAMGIYELLLSALVMVINQKFFISGFKGLIHKSPNMDTLVALGASASFLYSVCALFAMTQAVLINDSDRIMYYMEQFYFESGAMILTLITVGKMLEAKAKGKTTNAIKALINLAPKTAVLISDGIEHTVQIEDVKKGDYFVVRAGNSIPVDGIVIEGESAVNESALTGESIPIDKAAGDKVYAATFNTSGYMICEATRVGEDTTLAEIIRMVSDAASTKAPIAKIADRVSGVFVPTVMTISFVTFIAWLFVGQNVGFSLARAVSVLVISCPCALGLATPVAIMVGNGVGARTGILFKTAASLEQTGKTKIIALDKTGTITTGEMKVTDIAATPGVTESELLKTAFSLEIKSEHPISKAITAFAADRKIEAGETTEFEVVSGNGLKAKLGDDFIYGGNRKYIETILASVDENINRSINEFSREGKTPVLFAKGTRILGLIAVSDVIKPDSAKAVEELKQMGIRVVMLTGDNEITATAIAAQAGVDEVVASVKPDGKEAVISMLKDYGPVTMVGDGINDAPALTAADIGIAIGAGSDIAIDAADVVLMKSSLKDVAAAIRISRRTLTNIHENLFWAFFYNGIGIPLAAGCFFAAFGWKLSPMFGAAAMGLSSFCVVSNALRLNLIKPYDNRGDKKVNNPVTGSIIEQKIENNIVLEQKKEKVQMKISVKGMMCGHCEAHVKKALEEIIGIESAAASHEDNTVTLTISGEVNEDVIKSAIENAGYEYGGII